MKKLNLRTKALSIAALLSLLLISAILYIVIKLEKSADEIVESSKLVTEAAVYQLGSAGAHIIDSLTKTTFFTSPAPTRAALKHIDSMLASITSAELHSYHGMEGGYYFPQLDEFLGYSYPTSPAPKPAFGPPPRSYEIIKNQSLQSIKERRRITQVHQFDPAKFPLVTEPIELNGVVVGSVWTRVHIERLIPTFSLIDILIAVATIFLVGFTIALLASLILRKRVEEIRVGLQLLHTDGNFRFNERRGVFGEITSSINEMIEARALEQRHREKLEQELHQQDKMVTLGTLIAGVAHEVKTPLAVIKTRIQMWERKLRQNGYKNENGGIVTTESMDLVIREIDRLSDLVKRLLVFSKPVTNKLRLDDVNQLLLNTLDLVQSEYESKRITIQKELLPALPSIKLDPQAMEQVFLNILTNSLEAMSEGGSLIVRTKVNDGGESAIIVEIEDTGSGIAPDTLNQIFNPFFTTKESGVGLGLSISYEIVRAHKGRIEFPVSNSHGTLCRILLPINYVK